MALTWYSFVILRWKLPSPLNNLLYHLFLLEMQLRLNKKNVFVQSPKGWDDNVRWLLRSMWPSLLLLLAGLLQCLKGLSQPMSRIKVRLPNAPRVEIIMWECYQGQCGPLYCLYLLVLLPCLKGLSLPTSSALRMEMIMWNGYRGQCGHLICLFCWFCCRSKRVKLAYEDVKVICTAPPGWRW